MKKYILLFTALLFTVSIINAATRTIANGGGNWNVVGTWVEGIVPIDGDAVVATATSGQLTVNVASACTSIDLHSYTNTLTMSATLSVKGTVYFPASMIIAGASDLIVNANATLTSNGRTFSGGLRVASGITITLADSWTITGTLNKIDQVSGNSSINGAFNLNVGGGLNLGGNLLGTATVIMNGTGTWSGNFRMGMNLTFNTVGTITVSGIVEFNDGTLKYTAGTME